MRPPILRSVHEARYRHRPGEPAGVSQASQLEAKRQTFRERLRSLQAWKLTAALQLDEAWKLTAALQLDEAWKLTAALQLDEATAARQFPVPGHYDDKLEQLMRESRTLPQQLRMRASAREKGNDQEIDRLLDRVVAQQHGLEELQQERFRDVRKILAPERRQPRCSSRCPSSTTSYATSYAVRRPALVEHRNSTTGWSTIAAQVQMQVMTAPAV